VWSGGCGGNSRPGGAGSLGCESGEAAAQVAVEAVAAVGVPTVHIFKG